MDHSSSELNCHSDRSSVMPFGCTICLVDLERCPTSESNGPIESLRQSSGITAVPCGHVFHTVCIMQWLQCGEGCPYCREPFEEDEMQELFCSKLEDELPTLTSDANVDEETHIDTLRTTIKTLMCKKQEDDMIIKNLRSEISRMQSRLGLERTQARNQKEHLRLSLRNQEIKLVEINSERDIYHAKLKQWRSRWEDLEFVIYTERAEAIDASRRSMLEIKALKDQILEFEVESVRLSEQNHSLKRRIQELGDIDELIQHRVGKRLKAEVTCLN